MPVVIGAPDGERFEEKGGKPEGDWKMNEERMNVEHGLQAGEHWRPPAEWMARFWRRCGGDAKVGESELNGATG